jgi:hypothetical protein
MPGHGGKRTYALWNTSPIPTVAGIFFKLARCGYTFRVTSQTSYSPEYITPVQKIRKKSLIEKSSEYGA